MISWEPSGRKRSSRQAWGAGADTAWLLDDKGGFAGFAPEKRTRTSGEFGVAATGKQSEPNVSAAPNGTLPERMASHTPISGTDAAAPLSDPAATLKHSPDSPDSMAENHRPALLSMPLTGNKRPRASDTDVEMGCSPMRKRCEVQRRADAELDRPVYSERYMNQIKEHYVKQAESKGLKLRREAAAEIAAKTQKTVQSTARHASRIALENERLRHENHVLRCGMQTLSKRAAALDGKGTGARARK